MEFMFYIVEWEYVICIKMLTTEFKDDEKEET